MQRTIQRADGTIVERASCGIAFSSSDDEIRLRCRNAPVEIRRNIDAKREARGLTPLWPSISRRAHLRAGAAAAVARLRAFMAVANAD